MHDDLPTIANNMGYASNTMFLHDAHLHDAQRTGLAVARAAGLPRRISSLFIEPQQEEKTMAATRRLVQVFVADPNENIPLSDCLLYKGEQQLTDATDQELFFEIDIKSVLEAHNAKRVKIIDRRVKERTEYLQPAKIRDLKMVVVTIADF